VKPLFDRIKDFMRRLYKTVKEWVKLSPAAETFYESFLAGELGRQDETGLQTSEAAPGEAQTGKRVKM
jgi:hypothetical protein